MNRPNIFQQLFHAKYAKVKINNQPVWIEIDAFNGELVRGRDPMDKKIVIETALSDILELR